MSRVCWLCFCDLIHIPQSVHLKVHLEQHAQLTIQSYIKRCNCCATLLNYQCYTSKSTRLPIVVMFVGLSKSSWTTKHVFVFPFLSAPTVQHCDRKDSQEMHARVPSLHGVAQIMFTQVYMILNRRWPTATYGTTKTPTSRAGDSKNRQVRSMCPRPNPVTRPT